MALQNGSGTLLKGLSRDALSWLSQFGTNLSNPASDIIDLSYGTVTVTNTSHTFSEFKANGYSDDDAMAAAVARGGTLIIDQYSHIHLTRTFTINKPMQIISNQAGTSNGGEITTASTGGLFRIAVPASGGSMAPVLFQGLNIINTASSGSIVVMSGDHTVINCCQFANVAGNSSSMVKFQGYDQVISNTTFSNYEPTAYCWDATWVGGYNGKDGEPVNDRVVGGAAFGPGKGGLIANAGAHFTEGFSIDDWVCATEGVQVQALDVYSLEIRGGLFSGAKGSAIVLGGGNALVQSVVIQGANISAAGTAIDAAPTSGSGVNDLIVRNNQISGAGTGFALNGSSGHVSLIGNTITSSSLGLNIQNPASQVMVIDNTISGGGLAISDHSSRPNQVYFGNTINGPLSTSGVMGSSVIFDSNSGTAMATMASVGAMPNTTVPVALVQAVQAASTNVSLPNFVQTSSATRVGSYTPPSITDTFSHFKNPTAGVVLTDDQAFAAAIAMLGAVHGTLVIDNGLRINLTQTVTITNSMAIISAGSGLDTSSLITTTASQGMFQILTSGPVLLQGLNFKSGISGSIISTGTGNTVLRADAFTNVAGNVSPMVVLQSTNQMVQDCYFYNAEAAAYDWSAAYVNPSSASDTNTTISGGWAYGIGKGGLIGGNDAGPVIHGFDINNWTIVSKGATQIEAKNVASVNIQGGVYDWSTGSAIVLGGGVTRIGDVTINGAFISAAGVATIDPTKGIGINAGLTAGGGIANLTVTDNQINTVGTGLLIGGNTGNATISGNALRTGKVGIDVRSPTGAVVVVGNQDNPDNGSVAVQSIAAPGSSQTFVANTFNGTISINQTVGSTLAVIDNIGTGTQSSALGIRVANPTDIPASATASQIAALSTTVVAALSSSQIAGLTSTQVAALTSTQIGVLTSAQIAALTSNQLGALSSAQIKVLRTGQVMALTSSQIAVFSASQIAALTAAEVGVLTSSQVSALTTLQVASMTAAQIRALTSPQMHALTTRQVAALTTAQTGALTSSQVGALTSTQIAAISSTDIGALTSAVMKGLTTAQLHAISPTQMLGLSLSQISAFSTEQLEILVSNQFGRDFLFDAKYYLAKNPDVAAAGVDPYEDYMTYGWKEGRDPSALFNTKFYLAQNPDVRAAGVNPLAQFEINGWIRGTDPSTSFSVSKYLAANPDVAAAKMNPLLHYVISGSYQGRAIFASEVSPKQPEGVTAFRFTPSNTASVRLPVPSVSKAEQGSLTLRISESAWHGDAQFSLAVDGVTLSGTLTALASHAAGQSQTFTIDGAYAPGPHTVGVTFLNSLAGSDGARALFVDGMTYNGTDTAQTTSLVMNSTALLATTSNSRSTAITLNLSEDGFHNDAAAFISIDGKVQGGVTTITASHAAGATQAMKFLADLTPGQHTASVTLVGAGNTTANHSLYIDSLDVDLAHFTSPMLPSQSNGSTSFYFIVPPSAAPNGSLMVTAGAPSALSLLLPSS